MYGAKEYWGNWGFFCSAPQGFVVLVVFCARFPPREASSFHCVILLSNYELTYYNKI